MTRSGMRRLETPFNPRSVWKTRLLHFLTLGARPGPQEGGPERRAGIGRIARGEARTTRQRTSQRFERPSAARSACGTQTFLRTGSAKAMRTPAAASSMDNMNGTQLFVAVQGWAVRMNAESADSRIDDARIRHAGPVPQAGREGGKQGLSGGRAAGWRAQQRRASKRTARPCRASATEARTERVV